MSDVEAELAAEARSKSWADLLYESFYSGAIGGSIVAVFFLLIDTWHGRPLYTPALLGGVLFGGVPAESITELRLDWVAYTTVVHFAVFGMLGAALTVGVYEIELHARHPLLVLALLFVALEASFFAAAWLLLPGVIALLGFWTIALANFLAACGMLAFFWATHRPEAWERVKRDAHLV